MSKKTVKAIIILALMTVLCVGMVMTAGAVSYTGNCGAQGNNVTWEIDTNTATLYIRGNGEMEDYNDSSLTPWYDYYEDSGFIYIIVEDGVTSIGDFAFRQTDASKVTIGADVENIGIMSFPKNAEISINENNSCFKVDDSFTVYSKDGKTIVYASTKHPDSTASCFYVPYGVEKLAPYSFADFKMCGEMFTAKTFYIPETVTDIPKSAFLSIYSIDGNPDYDLTPKFIVNENNPCYSNDKNGILFDKNKEILYSAPCSTVVSGLYLNSYIIPETVKEIAPYAFWGYDSYSNIYITENVRKIGAYAFHGFRIDGRAYLYIPKTVTDIDELILKIESGLNVYYEGTQAEWNKCYNGTDCGGMITFYYEHNHVNETIETCTEIQHKCVVCNTVNEVEPGGEHDWRLEDKVFNCEEGGTAYYYCNDCMESKVETFGPKDHNWETRSTYTTDCEEIAVLYCKDCEDWKEEITSSWHDWYEYDFFGNCEEGGKMEYRCHNCSYEKYEPVAPKPHTIKWQYNNDATCTKDGTKYTYCTLCDYDTWDTPVTAEGTALGHAYGDEWTVLLPATCYDRGVQIKHCSRCTAITAEELPRTAHHDNDGDNKCDACSASLSDTAEPDDGNTSDEPSTPDEPDTPEEPKEEANVFSFLTELINTLVDFFRMIFGIA